jgi:hypothetical protein
MSRIRFPVFGRVLAHRRHGDPVPEIDIAKDEEKQKRAHLNPSRSGVTARK